MWPCIRNVGAQHLGFGFSLDVQCIQVPFIFCFFLYSAPCLVGLGLHGVLLRRELLTEKKTEEWGESVCQLRYRPFRSLLGRIV